MVDFVAELRRVAQFLYDRNRHGCAGFLIREANKLEEAAAMKRAANDPAPRQD